MLKRLKYVSKTTPSKDCATHTHHVKGLKYHEYIDFDVSVVRCIVVALNEHLPTDNVCIQ